MKFFSAFAIFIIFSLLGGCGHVEKNSISMAPPEKSIVNSNNKYSSLILVESSPTREVYITAQPLMTYDETSGIFTTADGTQYSLSGLIMKGIESSQTASVSPIETKPLNEWELIDSKPVYKWTRLFP